MTAEFIALLIKYGVEAVAQVVIEWRKSGEPTQDEILALRDIKDPAEYFGE